MLCSQFDKLSPTKAEGGMEVIGTPMPIVFWPWKEAQK